MEKVLPSDYPNPERAEHVSSTLSTHLIPFFDPRVDRISEISYEDCEDFVDFKSGRRNEVPSATTTITAARDLSLQEAADWCKKSKSTLRKAYLTKKFPDAYVDTRRGTQGTVRIPIGNLTAAGYVPSAKEVEAPYGYSYKHVSEMLGLLRQIFKFARAKQLMTSDPSEGIKPKQPARGSRSVKPQRDEPLFMFDLPTSKRIASQLHIHHQMAFWLMRCMGLRISETYGIALEDIHHDEGRMIIEIVKQGGKQFKVRDASGQTKVVTVKKGTKTKAGRRILPVPGPVADLVELYIGAFHGDDADLSTSLLLTSRGCGQAGFRDALEKANIAAAFGSADVGFSASPHFLRKCFTSDLDEISGRGRSVYLGHQVQDLEGGAVITEKTYTLRRRGVAHLVVVADTMASLIAESMGVLISPTPAQQLVPVSVTPDPVLRERAVDQLDAGDLIGVAEVDGEEVLEMAEAAELLAVSVQRVKHLAQQGVLERRRIPGAGRQSHFGVTTTSVKARLEIDQQLWTRQRLADEAGLTYWEIGRLLKQLGIEPVESAGILGHRYTADALSTVRQHLDGEALFASRAVPKSVAAMELGCTRRTIDRFLALGQLEVDEDATAASKMTMVTRSSLDRLITQREKRVTSSPVTPPEGTIPILEAQTISGLTRIEVLELRKFGVTIHRTADYQFHVDVSSLESHLSKRSSRRS